MKTNFENSYRRLKEIVYSDDNKAHHRVALTRCIGLVKTQYFETQVARSKLRIKEFDAMFNHVNKIK